MTQSIIIDTDPGQDDALAILLALASPELDVLGIVPVAGNAPIEVTSRNARAILELAGRTEVPVAAGAAGPIAGTLSTAEAVHGQTGLDGYTLPEPALPLDPRRGADFIVETVMERPAGTVTLCTMGPLTNVALALQQEPALAARLAGIVTMGGAFFAGGNSTPVSEWNILVDPEAAAIVAASGAAWTLAPLDCTHQLLTTPDRLARIGAIGTEIGRACHGWLDYYDRHDKAKFGIDGGPLHDPAVIAFMLKPDLFQGRFVNVEIETQSELTRGMTVFDWWRVSGRAPNCTVLHSPDADGFYDLLIERLGRL